MKSYPLQTAIELTELGRDLVAQRFRRENPEASEDEVSRAVGVWMADRKQAPHGDGPGVLIPWPLDR